VLVLQLPCAKGVTVVVLHWARCCHNWRWTFWSAAECCIANGAVATNGGTFQYFILIVGWLLQQKIQISHPVQCFLCSPITLPPF
jgi:hypothetical protein